VFINYENLTINLKNVVSVKLEDKKIIFNYNYNISLDGNSVSPDYSYIYVKSYADRNEIRKILEENNFISFKESDNYFNLVNLDNVSFIKEYIKPEKNKYRLIFNLCVSNTLRDSNTITSNAVYYDFPDEYSLTNAINSIPTIS